MNTLQIKKLDERAVIPTKGSPKAAGYDLSSIESYTLQPLERKLFKTGLSMSIPSGMYGRIAPRSGLAFKNGIEVMAGVIDEDYRGEVGVLLINLDKEPITLPLIKEGKEIPIAQIIFEFYNNVKIDTVNTLTETNRGEGGFGSTDKQPNTSTIKLSTLPSNLMDKYKEAVQENSQTIKYENLIKEREKSINQ